MIIRQLNLLGFNTTLNAFSASRIKSSSNNQSNIREVNSAEIDAQIDEFLGEIMSTWFENEIIC